MIRNSAFHRAIALVTVLIGNLMVFRLEAANPQPPMTSVVQAGPLITAETFASAASLATRGNPGWHGGIGQWHVQDAVLHAQEETPSEKRPNGHEAVCEYVAEFRDAIITAEFKLGDSPQIGIVCRDTRQPNHHLGRLLVTPERVWLQAMDGIAKETRKEILQTVVAPFEREKWYTAVIEIHQDQFTAHVGGHTLTAQHPRFGEQKGRVGLVAKGTGAEFRNVAVWQAANFQLDSKRPNIVFVLADDLGYGDLTCFGQKTLSTPNLDRLASEGMRFTRHYAGMTVCAPSRCVLMTGQHSGHAAVRTNRDAPMPDSVPTIANQLKSVGYATGAFGKWGIGNEIPEDDPNRKGFDQFYGYVDMFHAHNLFPPFMVRNGQREALRNVLLAGSDDGAFSGRGNGVAQEPIEYAPELFVNEALDFIDANADQPFFVYLALNTPHANNEGGRSDYGRGMEVPDFGPFTDRDWPKEEKGFARMMFDIDQTMARVADKLREHGIAENTLVIFTSDNGPHQEGGHLVDFFDSNGPLRGHKRDLYEGGIRVPTIAWWPNHIPAGSVSEHLSGFQDYLPTFCELVGLQAPPSDGLSLIPTLSGHAEAQQHHEFLYFEFYEAGGRQAVVTDRWKAVRLNWIAKPDGPLELYDLAQDLGEEHDVADQNPEIVRQMLERMTQSHADHVNAVVESNSAAK